MQRKSDKKIGYFAPLKRLTASKALYMSVEEVTKHAQQYSKSYGGKNSVWATDFDAMALKPACGCCCQVRNYECRNAKAYIEDSADTVSFADEAIQGEDNVFEVEAD